MAPNPRCREAFSLINDRIFASTAAKLAAISASLGYSCRRLSRSDAVVGTLRLMRCKNFISFAGWQVGYRDMHIKPVMRESPNCPERKISDYRGVLPIKLSQTCLCRSRRPSRSMLASTRLPWFYKKIGIDDRELRWQCNVRFVDTSTAPEGGP